MLRAHGVVGAFVEFAGDGLAGLSLADRATISNMSPEFGATATLFPIDDETLAYLRLTGRSPERVALVERYAKEQGLWREPGDGPDVRRAAELDLAIGRAVGGRARGGRRTASRSTTLRENFRTNFPNGLEADVGRPRRRGAGARRRRRRGRLGRVVPGVRRAVVRSAGRGGRRAAPPAAPVVADAPPVDARAYRRSPVEVGGQRVDVRTGSVAIAAITSCTNTSNPTVMVGAGPAGPQRRRARPARRPDGQDVAGARARGPSPAISRRPG